MRAPVLAVLVTCFLAIACVQDSVAQQNYPQQPIRLVVSFQSATTMDSVARMIASKLGEALGQAVIVDNRPGASGLIAEEVVAKAAPDGHTLLVAGLALATLPSIYGPRAVDPVSAFVPVAWLTSQPVAIIANPVLHIDTLAELIAEARRRPGQLAYSTNGVGGPAHLAAAILWSRAEVDLVVIPYNGAGLAQRSPFRRSAAHRRVFDRDGAVSASASTEGTCRHQQYARRGVSGYTHRR